MSIDREAENEIEYGTMHSIVDLSFPWGCSWYMYARKSVGRVALSKLHLQTRSTLTLRIHKEGITVAKEGMYIVQLQCITTKRIHFIRPHGK